MLAVVDAIQAEAADMDARWTGARPEPIPVIPDRLTRDDLLARQEIPGLLAHRVIPVGLDLETVAPAGVSPAKHRQVLVLGPDGETVAATMSALWDAAGESYPAGPFIIDDTTGLLRPLVDRTRGRGAVGGAQLAVLDAALAELSTRQEGFRRAVEGSAPPTLAAYVRGLGPGLVVVADASTIANEIGKERAKDLVRLLTDGPAYGLPLLLGAGLSAVGRGFDDIAKVVKRSTAGIVVGRLADQTVLKARNLGIREPPLGEHEAYIVADGVAVRVRLPEP